jgi:hypothetical protein
MLKIIEKKKMFFISFAVGSSEATVTVLMTANIIYRDVID